MMSPVDPAEAAHIARLAAALDHLRSFAQTFNPGDDVDEESQLTADDLFIAVEALDTLIGLAGGTAQTQ